MYQSYCCIEGANDTMCDVLDKFKTRQDDIQSSPYERQYIEPLYNRCKEFIQEYETYKEDKETYIKEHSREEEEEESW